jgi:hypothetical protein
MVTTCVGTRCSLMAHTSKYGWAIIKLEGPISVRVLKPLTRPIQTRGTLVGASTRVREVFEALVANCR